MIVNKTVTSTALGFTEERLLEHFCKLGEDQRKLLVDVAGALSEDDYTEARNLLKRKTESQLKEDKEFAETLMARYSKTLSEETQKRIRERLTSRLNRNQRSY